MPVRGNDIQKKAESVEAVQAVKIELDRLRAGRKQTPGKVMIDSLPPVALSCLKCIDDTGLEWLLSLLSAVPAGVDSLPW